MRQLVLFIAFAIASISSAMAQDQPNTFVFEGNNFRWTQTTNGSLFYDESTGDPGLEVPINEGNHAVYTSTLWLGGLNQSDELKIAFRRFCQNSNESCYENWGPLKLNGELSTTSEVADYNYIWFVTVEQIDNHVDYFDCLADPNCDESSEFPSYETPSDFMSWPAEGESGYDSNLAPYVDKNGNGSYNPEEGDYPAICGDFSSFTIWNDLGVSGSEQDGLEIGLEVHTTVYGYNATAGSDFNTLFVQYKLINRGIQSLSDTYAGLWNDFDLGNSTDDYLGTDVERSMFYVYNGQANDQPNSAGPGYGTDLPAMGVKVLSGPTAPFNGSDDNSEYSPFYGNATSGWQDGVLDNERLGLARSVSYGGGGSPSAVQGPSIAPQYYNYMKSIWRDGTPLSYGGIGYAPVDPEVLQAKYSFPGASDPLNAGTAGIDPEYPLEGGWTEGNEGFPSGDRRMISSSGPFTFSPGDVQYIDLAYIFARESFDEDETVIETLQRFADEVEGMQCSPLPAIVLSTDRGEERKPLQVYPNPSSESISFKLNEASSQFTLVDITGKVVLQQNLNSGVQRVDISNLTNGIYIIQVRSEKSIYNGKVIIEK